MGGGILKGMKKTTSGFTIVELLIVIVVIGILAAITIVAYNGIQERAQSVSIVSRAEAYLKGLKVWEADTGSMPAANSCLTTSNYSPCNVAYWGNNIYVDGAFMTQLAKYSGLTTPVLGAYTATGASVVDSPAGLMAYVQDWYGTGKATLMYTVGPNSDCSLGPLVDANHTSLAPAGQKYTARTSAFTRCEVRLN